MPAMRKGPNRAMVARMAMERAQGSDEDRKRKRQMMDMLQMRPQPNLGGARKRLEGAGNPKLSGY